MTMEQNISPVADAVERAQAKYYRLVLLVGPAQSGKTALLGAVAKRWSLSPVNVGLELSRRLLELTEAERGMRLVRIFESITELHRGGRGSRDVILLDNTEILFDPRLEIDPMRFLQGFSRNDTLIACWNGEVADNYITYAVPGHPEFRRYSVKDVTVVYLSKEQPAVIVV